MASNEIASVKMLHDKFGSGYWYQWDEAYCVMNNEIPKNVFDVIGNYGDTECVKIDDIIKKEVNTTDYYISTNTRGLYWQGTDTTTKQIIVTSSKRYFTNGVLTKTEPIDWDYTIDGDEYRFVFNRVGNILRVNPISRNPSASAWNVGITFSTVPAGDHVIVGLSQDKIII
ncbi:hypothetical protein ACGE0T_00760 [Parabacteroides sp. APC149_11_2_Y6]